MEYSDIWNPAFDDDFKFDFQVNPISYMRHMVFDMNESWDSRILGFRGNGKSTVGAALCLLFNPRLLDMSPEKALDRCWCFTTEERMQKKEKLRRGDVLCTDEQGTRKSGSSHKWQKEENQMLADSRQLDRVDGVMEIGITLDENRVINRIRNIYRVDIYPETKLTNEQNCYDGLAIDCIFREIVENPFSTTDKERFRSQYFKYADGGRITRATIPLPPEDFWNEYMIRRKEFKEALDREEVPTIPPKTKDAARDNLDKIHEQFQKFNEQQREAYNRDYYGK